MVTARYIHPVSYSHHLKLRTEILLKVVYEVTKNVRVWSNPTQFWQLKPCVEKLTRWPHVKKKKVGQTLAKVSQ